MALADIVAARQKAEEARGDALEAAVCASAEHAMHVSMLAERLAKSVEGLGPIPDETVKNLLLAVATFAGKGK